MLAELVRYNRKYGEIMNKSIIVTVITLVITSLPLTTQLVSAGTITDTYTTGTPLTATIMNNIKSAVNDNDGNISTNATGIADNTIKIDSVFGGDGSTGSLTVSVNTDWSQRTSFNFVDLNIDANVTLTVPAGTTIRCSGNFNNAGNIVVDGGVIGGNGGLSTSNTYSYRRNPHPGDSFGAAGNGGYDHTLAINSDMQIYGAGGLAIPLAAAASSYHLFRYGGGGGGTLGGDGGGLLKIYARGTITNQTNALIQSNGADGLNVGGGGGGGIIILASMTSVTNNGTIEANGGNGGRSRTFGWAGGGGGGGIAMLIAPSVNSIGTVSVTGGAGGPQIELPVAGTFGYGGGGGGASGGDGGNGGYNSQGTLRAPGDGTDGHTILVNSIPSSMF
jgi:hypothetical protein